MFKNSITIFQSSKLNHKILANLNNYNVKILAKDKPSYNDFHNIYHNFLNIHPDNFKILIDSYPEILFNVPSHKRLGKICIDDLNLIDELNFKKLKFNGPLIIDSHHNLLGNDDTSISRILHNFDYHNSATANVFKKYPNASNFLIHPHVAEFADLF